jgi:hypothetical protein
MSDLSDALKRYDRGDYTVRSQVRNDRDLFVEAARRCVNPDIKSAVRAYDEAPIPMLKEDFVRRIVAAAQGSERNL